MCSSLCLFFRITTPSIIQGRANNGGHRKSGGRAARSGLSSSAGELVCVQLGRKSYPPGGPIWKERRKHLKVKKYSSLRSKLDSQPIPEFRIYHTTQAFPAKILVSRFMAQQGILHTLCEIQQAKFCSNKLHAHMTNPSTQNV